MKRIKRKIFILFIFEILFSFLLFSEKRILLNKEKKLVFKAANCNLSIRGGPFNQIIIKGNKSFRFMRNRKDGLIYIIVSDKGAGKCAKEFSLNIPNKINVNLSLISGNVKIENIKGSLSVRIYKGTFFYRGKTFNGSVNLKDGIVQMEVGRFLDSAFIKTFRGDIKIILKNYQNLSLFFKTNYGKIKITKKEFIKFLFNLTSPIPQKKLFYNSPFPNSHTLTLISTYGNIVF